MKEKLYFFDKKQNKVAKYKKFSYFCQSKRETCSKTFFNSLKFTLKQNI